jgi:voltage-gated potassium channel
MQANESPARRTGQLPRSLLTLLGQTTVVLVLLTVAYYVAPLQGFWHESVSVLRFCLSLAAVLALGLVFRIYQRRRAWLPLEYRRVQWLLAALYLLVLTFATAYALVATLSPGQFEGIHDRTNALYFSMTVVSTVGLGDVHPTGHLAQLLVTAQMIFDLVYLGTALRLLGTAGRDGSGMLEASTTPRDEAP